jgi:glycosyltransferase involved in cell wall biosynthesis
VRHVVCHLISSNFAGGPEKQILEQCERLISHGWESVVGSFRENRPSVEIIEAARARHRPTFLIDTRSSFSLAAVSQLRRALTRFRTDVLVTHGYKPNLVGWLASRGSRWRQVPIVRGYTAETWRVRLYEALDRWVLRQFPRVLCVSEGTKLRLKEYGVEPDRVDVVHNAVDCGVASRVKPLDLRAQLSLPPDSKILVAAGRLSPEKGHHVLLDAMRELDGWRPEVHLLLLGSGAKEEMLRHRVEQYGLSKRVVFAGFQRNVLEYLAGADVVVNPSFTEGMPNVLLEASSLGRPIVATHVGGTAELVQNGVTGWLVPAGNPTALAQALVLALDDEPRARAMGARARRQVEARFSFEAQTEKLVHIYAELLQFSKSAPETTPQEST